MSFAEDVQQEGPGAPADQPSLSRPEPAAPRRGHEFEFNPNPLTRTWERLESMRLKKLGITRNYSRNFNVTRSFNADTTGCGSLSPRLSHNGETRQQRACNLSKFSGAQVTAGSFAPFHSQGKPTCGYFFSRDTDNKKQRIGIPAANLVKWRSLNAEELR